MRPVSRLLFGLLFGVAPLSGLAQVFPCAAGGGVGCTALIPDAAGGDWTTPDAPGVLVSTLDVAGGLCGGDPVAQGAVRVDLLHDWIADLRIRAILPDSTAFTLLPRDTGDFGGTPGEDVHATFVLGALSGLLTAGTWSLEITDYVNTGTGALEDWSVELVCPAPPSVSIVATQPNASEAPTVNGTFTVTRSTASVQPLVVDLSVAGSAGAGDFVPLALQVTIPGGAVSVSFDVVPIPDAVAEGVEDVVVTLEPAAGYTVGVPASATVNIADAAIPPGVPEIPTLGSIALLTLILLLAATAVWRLRGRRIGHST